MIPRTRANLRADFQSEPVKMTVSIGIAITFLARDLYNGFFAVLAVLQ